MLKIKSILVSLLAVAALASCSNENLEENPGVDGGIGYDVAYVSISMTNPKVPGSRASGEQPALPAESEIRELYVITFNASKVVTKDADATKYATILGAGSFGTNSGVTTPNTPIKVGTDTKYLLVIANPGYQLKSRLDAIAVGATYATINTMITVPTQSGKPNNAYLVEEVVHSNGCAMINVGFFDDSDSNPDNHAWKEECLLDVSDKIILASNYKTEAQALNAAKSNPATLEIERLAAKLEVMIGSSLEVGPFADVTNASLGQFDFGNWTIDYYNSLLFPFAKKTTTASSHTTGFYKSNFYTVDPNFTTAGGTEYLTGIVKNTLDANREPLVEWVAESVTAGDNYKYCIENTMAEGYQKFGAATRLVLKGKYAPWKDDSDFSLGDDWYRLPNGTSSVNFKNFALLLAAYIEAKTKETNTQPMTAQEKLLVSACELFYNQIKSELTTSDPGSFALLTQTIIDDNNIQNGGELCKEEGCIYWYPKSLNYYYYEIRHDNTADSYMEYGKYGVVRNNYYTLTLTKVNGNGTPWYPGGGPEDPDDNEDIDKLGAYLHFEIKVAPWIYWTTNFEI
ncbi:Mfa1 family fimbria major subunit [Bacteroides xylanisolvens]|uniref:Mfa1 family fimbria major subunit n=1 Tax=Bacteroides xylanisolvens TaxID=371601 RepID=UPI001897A71C|nr:Mfa1 family fimbria major subunit [Bacteroides xylanisolvens]